ncbi:hypothetical protein HDF26_000842 [Pedobacter cryoconitis]|uniref:Uncharacterized protein n=1 Tax=Pedobacter cryoconitis TaxID=188932 RepID=A0A7W8ZPJ8_9SPHI|nr:hypothetical protein [Pedobacter cryoconitis]MBB5637829.1 hypothetical protein [Pedobacter cryoconitis]MBB6270415.1 hypothetical protein [Pedobacter cryoconitis]
MPWYQFINNDLDICDPDSYAILEKAPDVTDGPYLAAVFADEFPNDPERRPDLEGTPGLLFYLIRALAKGKGQPASKFPPVPLEVRMSAVPANGVPRQNTESPE